MISDPDIDRSALLLIRQYGELAALQAAIRAYERLERGDMEDYAIWKRILWAIERLQAKASAKGEAVH